MPVPVVVPLWPVVLPVPAVPPVLCAIAVAGRSKAARPIILILGILALLNSLSINPAELAPFLWGSGEFH